MGENKKFKVFFVVLHYQAKEMTISCVNALLELAQDECLNHIIVVDNNSPNNSGVELKKQFEKNKHITVICNSSNLGFARGNNVGFRSAKECGADYIVVLNNDVIIRDKNFTSKIETLFHQEKYGVLGPDVLSVEDRVHQNPMRGFEITKATVIKKIVRAYAIRLGIKLGMYPLLSKMADKRETSDNNNGYKMPRCVEASYRYILHGSCLVFAEPFIRKFDGFFEGTYMYFEEHILSYMCLNNGIKMLYTPEIQVEHYRGIATKTLTKETKLKMLFFQEQAIKSLKALLGIIT